MDGGMEGWDGRLGLDELLSVEMLPDGFGFFSRARCASGPSAGGCGANWCTGQRRARQAGQPKCHFMQPLLTCSLQDPPAWNSHRAAAAFNTSKVESPNSIARQAPLCSRSNQPTSPATALLLLPLLSSQGRLASPGQAFGVGWSIACESSQALTPPWSRPIRQPASLALALVHDPPSDSGRRQH